MVQKMRRAKMTNPPFAVKDKQVVLIPDTEGRLAPYTFMKYKGEVEGYGSFYEPGRGEGYSEWGQEGMVWGFGLKARPIWEEAIIVNGNLEGEKIDGTAVELNQKTKEWLASHLAGRRNRRLKRVKELKSLSELGVRPEPLIERLSITKGYVNDNDFYPDDWLPTTKRKNMVQQEFPEMSDLEFYQKLVEIFEHYLAIEGSRTEWLEREIKLIQRRIKKLV